ncbi:MAG TPA: hypothetical protein VM553_02695, partial [Dongiaceae bacterium]|nr:hypothetical protein [Dongiaceae bacterium]
QQELDAAAQTLLGASYADLLAWSPADTNALRRPDGLTLLSTALADGIPNNDLKRLVQQWTGSVVSGASVGLPGFVTDLVLEGSYLYVPRNAGAGFLDILDVRNPQNPVVVNSLALILPQSGLKIMLQNGYAYVLSESYNSGTTLVIVDVRDPEHPLPRGRLSLQGSVYSLAVAGDYVFTTEYSYSWPDSRFQGINVIDVSDPLQPTKVASLPLGTIPVQLAASGQHLYVSGGSQFSVVDISNPLAPVLAATLQHPSNFGAIAVQGDKVYLGTTDDNMVVIDVSDPTSPVLLATLELDWMETDATFGPLHSIQVVGNEAFLAFGAQGVHRVDISNPAEPRWAGSLDITDFRAETFEVAVGQGLVIAAIGSSGIKILDQNALQREPVLVGSLDLIGRVTRNAVATARAIFTPVLDFGFSVISLRNPRAPTLVATEWRRSVYKMDVSDRYAFLGEFSAFSAMNVINLADPVELPGAIDLTQRGYRYLNDIKVEGDYAYLGMAAENGQNQPVGRLVVLDIQEPQLPKLMTQLTLPFIPRFMAIQESRVYTAAEGQLQVIDIENPLQPLLQGNLEVPAEVQFIAADGDYLYLACGKNGLLIVDVSDPIQPTLVATILTASSADAVTLADGYAFVADAASGVVLIDVTQPSSPVVIGNATVRGNARVTFVQHGLLYAGTSYGLDVLKKPRAISN